MFKKIIGVLAGGVVVAVLAIPSLSRGDINKSVAYLESKSLSAWSVMALVSAGKNPSTDSLKSISATQAIDLEAPILALTAAGKDPRSFSTENLVTKLKNYYDGTQLGSASILNDDIFGLLALKSSGESDSDTTVSGTKALILSKQNSDGGWSYAIGGASDTNTTAAGIMALISAGQNKESAPITNGLNYLKSAQNIDGGFPYDPKSAWGTDSDASSDAWVIMALRSVGIDPATITKDGKSALTHLATLSTEEGYYRYQAGSSEDSFSPTTTSYAVIALSGKYLPVGTIAPPPASKAGFSYRIEGASGQLCAGEADGLTALDAVVIASEACNITYHMTQMSFGDYVDAIGGETAFGTNGWMYLVDNQKPSVGAGDYKLSANDEVLWYYGDYAWQPLRLSLNSTSTTGSTLTGKLEYFDGTNWKYSEGATIKANDKTATTGIDGTFSLTLSNGAYKVFGEKNGFIHSNRSNFNVGTASQSSLDLTVDLGSGGNSSSNPDPTQEISFSVQTENSLKKFNFGKKSNGALPVQKATLTNLSASPTHFESSVSGDEVFRNYLNLDGKTWRMFGVNLAPGGAKQTEISLKLPSGHTGTGVRNGSLIFWATPAL